MGLGSGILDPRSGIRDPGSEIQDPRSGIRDPGPEIRDPRSGIHDPELTIYVPVVYMGRYEVVLMGDYP